MEPISQSQSQSESQLGMENKSKCQCKCSCASLLSWEKPTQTGIFLLAINISYLIFKSLHLHLVPLLIQMTFFSTIGHIGLKPFYKERFHQECSDSTKDKMVDCIYKKINECSEKLKKMTSMEDKGAVARVSSYI